MSEQEWTAKLASHGWYVEFDAMNGACIDNELTAKGIANTHNAALAAERERADKAAVRAEQAQIKLAAAVEALEQITKGLWAGKGDSKPIIHGWEVKKAREVLAKIGKK